MSKDQEQKDFLSIMRDKMKDPFTLGIASIVGAAAIALPIYLISKPRSEKERPNNSSGDWTKSSKTLPIVRRSTSSINIGSNYNEWREPVFEIGYGEGDICRYFIEKGLHVDQTDWEDSCRIMDKVMKVVAREMKNSAKIHFPGLVLDDNFIKQGSSREGLKVCDPLEFDFLLPFRLEGLRTKKEDVFDRYGNVLPGIFKEKIINDYDPPTWMRKNDVLVDYFEGTYINTNNFQKKVFTSLLDKSMDEINRQLQRQRTWNESYRIYRSVYAPNLKITIQVRSPNGLKGLDRVVFESSQGLEVIDLEADWFPPFVCLLRRYQIHTPLMILIKASNIALHRMKIDRCRVKDTES